MKKFNLPLIGFGKKKSENIFYGKYIHFIGIGGSGIVPLAHIAADLGAKISGSDLKFSETTHEIAERGVKIFIGHNKSNLTNADMVVYSTAVKKENPELQSAFEKNIPVFKRSEFLGLISKSYSNVIAISGSHGKTTTTAMIAKILRDLKLDPTVVIGSEMMDSDKSYMTGYGNFFVCEACEFMDSFLDLEPTVGVILNVDNDHLDYFGTLENEIESFKKFAKKCKKVVINADDKNAMLCAGNTDDRFYSINGELDFKLKIPGTHNISNALAAISTCETFGLSTESCIKSLQSFAGTRRRFELLAKIDGVTVMDDFAHHPTEIRATANAVLGMGFKNILLIFQPHTFSRTFILMNEFVESLSLFGNVILTDILPVREINVYGIKSEDLAAKIPGCKCLGTFARASDFAAKNAVDGDLILTMGGGNISECTEMIIKKLEEKQIEKS